MNVGLDKGIYIECAPVAGYTDQAFRRVLIRCGAMVVYTEMVSATAMAYGSVKTLELLRSDFDVVSPIDSERIKTIVQLFGKVPEHFTVAIKSGHLDKFDEININMGCPAPKIVKNGEGSALMKSPDLARQIIEACVKASTEKWGVDAHGSLVKPVTVKFRLGYTEPVVGVGNNGRDAAPTQDNDKLANAKKKSLEKLIGFARMCESAGAGKIIVHGRYASQGYSGVADWNQIAEVVKHVGIPVIANGDVIDRASAKRCLDITGAYGVMIARGLFGRPWQFETAYNTQQVTANTMCEKEFSLEEKKAIVRFHIDTVLELYGEDGFREMKKHLLNYCDSLGISKEVKRKVAVAQGFVEVRELMDL